MASSRRELRACDVAVYVHVDAVNVEQRCQAEVVLLQSLYALQMEFRAVCPMTVMIVERLANACVVACAINDVIATVATVATWHLCCWCMKSSRL